MSKHRIPRVDFKILNKRENKFTKTSKMMEGLCFAISIK
jgi:hypothetical protein